MLLQVQRPLLKLRFHRLRHHKHLLPRQQLKRRPRRPIRSPRPRQKRPPLLLQTFQRLTNEADYNRGRRQFATCRSCHLIEEGAPHRVGPNLHGIFGSAAGAKEDFRYSKALEEAGFEWTPEQLDAWLANPKEFLPGNRMTFPGIAKPDQRRDLIAYLLVETAKQD